jgi:hypothetical protein
MNPLFGLILLAVMVGTILILYSAVQHVHLRRDQSQELSELNAVLREIRRLMEDNVAWQRDCKRLLEETVSLQKQTNGLIEQIVFSKTSTNEK